MECANGSQECRGTSNKQGENKKQGDAVFAAGNGPFVFGGRMFLSQREPATGRVLHRLCWFLAPWYYLQIATMASPNLIAAKADGATVDSTKKNTYT